MAGLVNYGSSDDEDDIQDTPSQLNAEKPLPSSSTNGHKAENEINGKGVESSSPSVPPPELDAPFVGPSLGPSSEQLPMELLLPEDDGMTAPQSPYSTNRALLRDLTLPTLANYEIPPSPPGSPAESTNAKFRHFLDLKKKGVHFNEKLAKSPALKNPSLTQKLMDFSDIDEGAQYATTLPTDLWNPDGFPESAYKEELAKSQQRILKRKEKEKTRGQRESVEFVPATATSDSIGRGGTPSLGSRGAQKSAAERVMAGLERGRSSSPQVQGTKRKTRFDS